MYGNSIKLKEDDADYIIYHPYPFTPSIPLISDPLTEGCQWVSIDPGIRNFAIRIERSYDDGRCDTVFMCQVDLKPHGDISETKGKCRVDPQILSTATQVLMSLYSYLKSTRIVVIERQMAVNYKSSRIFQHVLTFFLLMIPTFEDPKCIVTDVSPKVKGRELGAPPRLTRLELNEWSVAKSIELFILRNDSLGLQIMNEYRGKSKSKTRGADMADTTVQTEALRKLWYNTNTNYHSNGSIIEIPNSIIR